MTSSDLLLAWHPEPLLLEPLQLTALLVEQQLVGDGVGMEGPLGEGQGVVTPGPERCGGFLQSNKANYYT